MIEWDAAVFRGGFQTLFMSRSAPPHELWHNITPVIKAEKYLRAHIPHYKCTLKWTLSNDRAC